MDNYDFMWLGIFVKIFLKYSGMFITILFVIMRVIGNDLNVYL